MEQGEKYLDVKLVGHEFVRVFPNKDKTGNQPDFKSDGCAVWVKQVKPKQEQIPVQKVGGL